MSHHRTSHVTRVDPTSTSRLPVLATCLVLVLTHTAFRAWAAFGAWFQEDDFEFLRYSRAQPFSLDYLMEPHSGHLMPLGRVLIDLSVASGMFNWAATAAVTVLFQAAVGLSAFWMLKTLFGLRWGIVPPLLVFLFSAITMPATVWWAVAVNQLAQEIGLMCAVACWVIFERTGRKRWAVLVVACVLLALAADIRGLTIPPVLAAISLGWFETGSLRHRLWGLVRRHWRIGLLAGAVCVGTVAYYSAYVPLTTKDRDWDLLGPLASTMLGTAFTTGIVGGPWEWLTTGPPTAFADPPNWLAHLSWVVIGGVMAHAFLTRRRTGRAWALCLGYLVILLLLLWSSRAPFVGPVAGTEYRYLTDTAGMAALALGLAYLNLEGAPDSSAPRDEPLFTPRLPVQVPIAVATVIAISGVWSSVQYSRIWHDFTQPRDYVETLTKELAKTGPVAVADTGLSPAIVSPIIWPEDRLSRLVGLLSPKSQFPSTAHDLTVVDDKGLLSRADLKVRRTSIPGPDLDCGWKIEDGSATIALDGPVIDLKWWMRISYLAPQETSVLLRAGSGDATPATLKAGLNQLYVHTDGAFESVDISGIDSSITVCIDKIEVGTIVPGAPLT